MLEDMDAAALGPDAVTRLREKRYMDARLEGMTATDAAARAGYGPAVQRTPVKLIETTDFRLRFQQLAEQKGLTLGKIADKIREHLDAKDGATNDADFRTQQRAIDQLTDLLGMNDARRDNQAAAAGGLTINITIPESAAARMVAAQAQLASNQRDSAGSGSVARTIDAEEIDDESA